MLPGYTGEGTRKMQDGRHSRTGGLSYLYSARYWAEGYEPWSAASSYANLMLSGGFQVFIQWDLKIHQVMTGGIAHSGQIKACPGKRI